MPSRYDIHLTSHLMLILAQLEKESRLHINDSRIEAEKKEIVRSQFMHEDRSTARRFAEKSLQREWMREQFIQAETPGAWEITQAFDSNARVPQVTIAVFTIGNIIVVNSVCCCCCCDDGGGGNREQNIQQIGPKRLFMHE